MSITFRTTHLFIAAIAVLGVAMVDSGHSVVRAATERPDRQGTEKKADGSRSVWDGVYTDEQAKRGAPLYSDHCASCHGSTLEGVEIAPSLVGSQFTANWNRLTVGDLFDTIRVSMPENDPSSVSRQQKVDVLAYILSYNKFPAGKTELASEIDVLKQIRFEALKPQ